MALVTIAADGSDLRRVTTVENWRGTYRAPRPADAWIESVAWSPAGTHILVRPADDDQHPAFVADVEGPGQMAVGIVRWAEEWWTPSDEPFLGIRAAAWSPDGARLVLVGPTHVVTVAADGGPLRGLAQWHESDQSWQPLNVGAGLAPIDVTGCTTGAAVPDPDPNPGLVTDCATLLEVQQALADGAALNWDTDTPISEWDGITLGGTPRRVHELWLERLPFGPVNAPIPTLSGLHRSLPAALGRLTHVRVLNLVANQLTGPIPAELGELASLRELHLDFNHLSGPIPLELAHPPNLEILVLEVNELSGPIPPELSRLANLTRLSLGSNALTGPIPPELGGLANLEYLGLFANQLTGSIPPELGRLSALQFLDLAGNRLAGSLPPELGQLGNLNDLRLTDNQLTGPIPAELGEIETLGSLNLTGNQLTGCIPAVLSRLKPQYTDVDDLGLPYCESAA
ncbi:MAG: hypothetical protein OXP73_13820 [Chloroflexota bacterium]|nr:hypothetical protein [Chloroflexota bacterium]